MSSSCSRKQLVDLQIPLEEIVCATNNFSDANLIKRETFGNEYRGKLLRSGQLIHIAARRFDETHGLGQKQFWKEVVMLSTLRHENIVSILGFCDENGEKIVINKHELYGGLDKYLSSTFTWMQRLKICVGVARALSYMYYEEGRGFSIIHGDIKSSSILLDNDLKPKLCGFELSVIQVAAERNSNCSRDVFQGMPGYCDPTSFAIGTLSHKSDIFSLGVVLYEVLCSKRTELINDDDKYLFPLSQSDFEGGRLDDLVNPRLREKMDPQSFKIFSETAYWCSKAEPSERPNIDQIVVQLEKALELQQEHESRLISEAYSKIEGPTSLSLKHRFSDSFDSPTKSSPTPASSSLAKDSLAKDSSILLSEAS